MTRLTLLLSFCLAGLATSALAQDASSSAPAAAAAGPAIASADAFKMFVDACTDASGGEAGAYDRLNDGGWTPNETDQTGPYNAVYSGYRDVDGLGEVDLWGSVQSFPTQRLGYCRIDLSDAGAILDFNDINGLKGLTGTLQTPAPGNVFGAWETPDKKLLVIGDRSDGAVELEFNLLLGDKPKQ